MIRLRSPCASTIAQRDDLTTVETGIYYPKIGQTLSVATGIHNRGGRERVLH